jgi:hypothetical protein
MTKILIALAFFVDNAELMAADRCSTAPRTGSH